MTLPGNLTSADVEKKHDAFHATDEIEKCDSEMMLEVEPDFTKTDQARIIRRVDIRLIGTLGALNCICLMDRLNLSSASIAGMTADLHLNIGYRYSLILLVFFITYIICQPPMTVLCRKVGPRIFLACTALIWGALMLGFGFSKSWTTMIPLRLVLGFCEGGFYPGAIYLISTWYTRYEVQRRYTFFYLIGIVASACSGILAYALMQMQGLGGLAGWRWIFIMEGILTFVVGTVAYFTLIDFPDQVAKTARGFLRDSEIRFIINRIEKDRADVAAAPFNFRKWIASGADPKIWGFALIVACCSAISYSIAYFLPIILHNEMGFSIAKAQCLVAPPYGFAAFVMIGSAWAGDKYHVRGPILVANALLIITGLPVMAFPKSSAVRYFGVFLVTAGSCSILPTAWAYQANNIRGQWKRAFGSASLVGTGGIGAIAGSLVFRSQDAPRYLPGIFASMGFAALIIIIVIVQTIYFVIENRKADRHGKVLEGNLDFRYTI